MLADTGLGLNEVVVLHRGAEGTTATMASDIEHVQSHLDAGLGLQEILEPHTSPGEIDKLSLLG